MNRGPEYVIPKERRNERSLRTVYEDWHLPLVRLGVLLSGSKETAEDLAHEAFLRAAKQLPELPEAAIWPYLRRVVVNLWNSRLRRWVVERRLTPAPLRLPDRQDEVEDRDELWRAIRRLPDRQRTCIVLRYYEDLMEREVATILGCSVGTVKSHTSRALERLREEVQRG